jgi:hypothetical protein
LQTSLANVACERRWCADAIRVGDGLSRARRGEKSGRLGRLGMAAKSRSKPKRSGPFLRLAYSAPLPDESIGAEIRRFTLPATKALPFVKVRANDQPLWRPESFWNVVSTGKRGDDVRLGRKYARLAIAAMKADHDSDLIALVIQDIIKNAIEHVGKNRSGRTSPAALGFLAEISEVIAAR